MKSVPMKDPKKKHPKISGKATMGVDVPSISGGNRLQH